MAGKTYLILFFFSVQLFGQQIADESFDPPVPDPLYPKGQGPVVRIDKGHHNFHTRTGRYQTFARLLEKDGYRVEDHEGRFTSDGLEDTDVLVISNALHEINGPQNDSTWALPNPSAFTDAEIKTLNKWVKGGGRLFLIADHMPFPGAAKKLAATFGFEFHNGFNRNPDKRGPSFFTLEKGALGSNALTKGRNETERVDFAVSFTGQAFRIPPDATPILTFQDASVQLYPDTAWQFQPDTPKVPIKGWSQGAYKLFGKGRIVVFGEAAMFSAQLGGEKQVKMGMNAPFANQNYQLLLNIMHWLDGTID